MIKEIAVYQTSYGKRFETLEEAEISEKLDDIHVWYVTGNYLESGSDGSVITFDDIARWLTENRAKVEELLKIL